MSDKSPRQHLSKTSGQSIKEKRAVKKSKKDDGAEHGTVFPVASRAGRGAR